MKDMPPDKPRLIERAFPLKQASLDSVHEKNVRHGHISTLHIWPARRPLAACRAALIATLLPDPGTPEERQNLCERIGGKVVQKMEKKKMPGGRSVERIKERTEGGILHWLGSEPTSGGTKKKAEYRRKAGFYEEELEWFRQEIRKAYGGRTPRILDPFAGGGAIPLEAMRLGCEVTAVDINPVAWFILKCTLEYPHKLAGKTHPLPDFILEDEEFMTAFYKAHPDLDLKAKRPRRKGVTPGLFEQEGQPPPRADLAWHVRAWGKRVLSRARRDLAKFYPTYADFEPLTLTGRDARPTKPYEKEPMRLVPLKDDGTPDIDALNGEFSEEYLGDKRNPRWVPKPTVAYLWARTVTCKNCRATIPLLKTRWLCKKANKRVLLSVDVREVGQTPMGQAPVGQAVLGQSLVGQSLVGQALVGQSLVGQSLVGQSLVGQASVGQAPVGQALVGQALVGQASVGQAPVGQAPVGQALVGQASVPADLKTFRRRLPHWRLEGATYFVTWRLHHTQRPLTSEERSLVLQAIRHFDSQRYDLQAWVVMDDHVHVIVHPRSGHDLSAITHSWKSFTANQLQRKHARRGSLWQDESWDRVIRDEQEYREKAQYILNNPLKRWPEIAEYSWVGFRDMAGTEACPTMIAQDSKERVRGVDAGVDDAGAGLGAASASGPGIAGADIGASVGTGGAGLCAASASGPGIAGADIGAGIGTGGAGLCAASASGSEIAGADIRAGIGAGGGAGLCAASASGSEIAGADIGAGIGTGGAGIGAGIGAGGAGGGAGGESSGGTGGAGVPACLGKEVVFGIENDVPVKGGNAAQRREHDKRIGAGTMSRAGAKCPCCAAIMTMEDLRIEGRAGRLGAVMTSVVVDARKGKAYRLPTEHEIEMAEEAEKAIPDVFAQIPFGLPEEPLPSKEDLRFRVPLYGFDQWKKLFTPRQLLALGTFVQWTRAVQADLGAGTYTPEWRETLYLGLTVGVDRIADRQSTVCRWDMGYTKLQGTFTRFALPITWDYCEGNPLSGTTGNYLANLQWVAEYWEHAMRASDGAPVPHAKQCSAIARQEATFDLVVTDPPYYDAIPYADLMDFFYVWLRRTLSGLSVELDTAFHEPLSPKWDHQQNDGELIDDASRHEGDKARSKAAYEDGMGRAFRACAEALTPDGKMVVVFANKQPDAWETLVSAIIRAGFTVDGSWPIRTEMGNRTRALSSAALASSVWLVCKKRPPTARPGWDNQVLEEMRTNIATRLREFWDAGIRGPDFVWAATGPALEAYSKHPVVKKANAPGQVMAVGEFLSHVRRMVVDFVVGRMLSGGAGGAGTEAYPTMLDAPTAYYLLHRHDFGLGEAPSGACILYATACGLSDHELEATWDILARTGGSSGGQEEDEDADPDAEADPDSAPDSGSKVKLKTWAQRKHKSMGYEAPGGRPVPLIDRIHRLMHLWRAGDALKVDEYLDEHGLRRQELFRRLLQSLIELSPAGCEERTLLESLSNHVQAKGAKSVTPQKSLPFAGEVS